LFPRNGLGAVVWLQGYANHASNIGFDGQRGPGTSGR
jgi:hypothetical protein